LKTRCASVLASILCARRHREQAHSPCRRAARPDRATIIQLAQPGGPLLFPK
jgi:hypothetical protein